MQNYAVYTNFTAATIRKKWSKIIHFVQELRKNYAYYTQITQELCKLRKKTYTKNTKIYARVKTS